MVARSPGYECRTLEVDRDISNLGSGRRTCLSNGNGRIPTLSEQGMGLPLYTWDGEHLHNSHDIEISPAFTSPARRFLPSLFMESSS